MKLWFLYVLHAFLTTHSIIMACEEQVVEELVPYKHRHSSKHNSDVISYNFQPSILNGYHIERTITIVCSNVSASFWSNYKSDRNDYPPNLKIVDSVIAVLPSRNSSQSGLDGVINVTLDNLSIEKIEVGAFKGLDELNVLSLSGNKLTEIEKGIFDGLSLLLVLDLSKNKITRVDGLASLRLGKLSLSQNKLSDLDPHIFGSLTHLQELDVSDNPLRKLPNVTFIELRELTARNIQLSTFDIDLKMSKIVSIDLSGNNLETINFDKLPRLKELNLSNNRLKELQNWNKDKVVKIDLSNNPSLN